MQCKENLFFLCTKNQLGLGICLPGFNIEKCIPSIAPKEPFRHCRQLLDLKTRTNSAKKVYSIGNE